MDKSQQNRMEWKRRHQREFYGSMLLRARESARVSSPDVTRKRIIILSVRILILTSDEERILCSLVLMCAVKLETTIIHVGKKPF